MAAGKMLGAAVLVILLCSRLGGTMPGGFYDIDVNSQEVREAARFAIEEYNRGSNGMYLNKIARVISAESQVVQGMMYHVRMQLGETTCRKSARVNVELERCSLKPGLQTDEMQVCTFQIWDRPWIPKKQLSSMQCVV